MNIGLNFLAAINYIAISVNSQRTRNFHYCCHSSLLLIHHCLHNAKIMVIVGHMLTPLMMNGSHISKISKRKSALIAGLLILKHSEKRKREELDIRTLKIILKCWLYPYTRKKRKPKKNFQNEITKPKKKKVTKWAQNYFGMWQFKKSPSMCIKVVGRDLEIFTGFRSSTSYFFRIFKLC